MHEVEFALLENVLGAPLRTGAGYRVWGRDIGLSDNRRFGVFDPKYSSNKYSSNNDNNEWSLTFSESHDPVYGTFAEILAIVSDPAWQRKHLACGKTTPSK